MEMHRKTSERTNDLVIWGGKLGGDVLWRVNNHSFYRGQILWGEI